MSEHTGQLNPPLKALEICNQGTVMHPRKNGVMRRSRECVENVFDGEQRCVSSDNQNHPIRYFFARLLLSEQGNGGPSYLLPRPPTPTLPKTSSELSLQ